jgi:hypothetical protein
VNAVPLDALVLELGSNRNTIYKTLFDARRKVRAAMCRPSEAFNSLTDRAHRFPPIE